jgi:hypothetical protein
MRHYVLSNDYRAAMDYVYKADMAHCDVVYVGHPNVLTRVKIGEDRVIAIEPTDQVSEAIIGKLAIRAITPEWVTL